MCDWLVPQDASLDLALNILDGSEFRDGKIGFVVSGD
jgi:hypothetical protein